MNLNDMLQEGYTSELRPFVGRTSGYLGMSMIGGCPLQAYRSFFGLNDQGMQMLWYGFSGRAYEDAIYNILSLKNVVVPKDHYMYNVEADFDSRYRGHPDIIIEDGDSLLVVDVKTVDWKKYIALVSEGKLPYSHEKNICQVESYMAHGGFGSGAIIYTPRDIPHFEFRDLVYASGSAVPFHSIPVRSTPDLQLELDNKARNLLSLIDDGGPAPDCTCTWCSS